MGTAVTPALLARVLLALAAIGPWSVLLSVRGALGFAVVMVAVVASLHGWGLLVKRLARIEHAPAGLVVHWGLAALVALGGVAMAVHALDHTTQVVLMNGGLVLNASLLIADRRAHETRVVEFLRAADSRYLLAPAIALALVATLHVLGTAGDVSSSPFDDDGSIPAQLRRLWDTGTLADPLGFARGSQLGGHLVSGAMVTALAGGRWFRAVDGLGFALLLWLALGQLRPRSATASLWAVLVIFVAAAYPWVAITAMPRWLVTSMLLSLYVTFERYAAPEDDRWLWPLGLIAGAIAVTRTELLPISITILVAAGIVAIGRSGSGRRLFTLVAVPLATVIPFVVVRITARGTVPSAALAAILPHRGIAIAALVFIGLVIVALWIVARTLESRCRWFALAGLVGLAGIVTQLSGLRPSATVLIWPILVSAGVAIGLDALRNATPGLRRIALVLSLLAAVLIYDGRDTSGRVRWARRYTELAANMQYLRDAFPPRQLDAPYESLLAKVPADTIIAVSVARPELLDYAAHQFIDVRAPRTAPRRAAVLRSLKPAYLLFEDDHLPAERARRELFYRLVCSTGSTQPYCHDDLQALVPHHTVVASEGAVSLVRLSPDPVLEVP